MMPSRWCIQYISKFGRPSSSHQIEKAQSSCQFPSKVVLKNALTIGQLHSSPMLVRTCLQSCMLGFSIMWTKHFQISKLGLEKEENQESNCQHLLDHEEGKGIPEKQLPLFQGLCYSHWLWIITNCGKLLDGNTRPSYLSPEKPVCRLKSSS